ncbi:FtsL-like putative cell division protein [Hymenobacter setariae]|uniref:FtsL-like putative cell division protein n=1 Tax=Hymenobacter setariae TaxID=2594794 RepID=UPI001F196664|nr:FtsL-like putative cell division protein [Hymenobacter setariae]
MAANTLRPTAGPPRTNVARPTAPPAPEPTPAPAPVAPEPLPAPVAAVPEPEVEKPAPPRRKPAPEQPERPASTWSLFSLLDRFTGLDSFFEEGLPVQYLPKVLFIMLLTLLYIGNTHYGNRMNRNIQRLKLETEDLRADYTTLSSDYMEASKQSEVARKVAAIGLVESSSPPFRIAVPAGRLDEAELEDMPVLTADTLAARAARDSAAAQRADSLLGRARRQQAAEAAGADDALEAGPPPPGLEEEVDNDHVASEVPAVQARKAPVRSSEKSSKKSKTAQNKTTSTRSSKPRAEVAKGTKKKEAHERKR